MSTFLLTHGAWHGAWCWEKVKTRLEAKGHTVLAPDMPGHGNDRTPVSEISLDVYAKKVADVASGSSEEVIAVGHSMGGLIISQAAEMLPEKFQSLVYLAGFLPSNGQTMLEIAQPDEKSLVLPNVLFSDDQSTSTVNLDAVSDVFYADCSGEDIELAKSLLGVQASAPLATPVSTTADRWGSIDRYYIQCMNDCAISPSIQEAMFKANPCVKVFEMNTSHSPFLSQPDEVVKLLTSI